MKNKILNKLIDFVLKKYTGYYEIKAENEKLKKDIYILVEKKDKDYITVWSKYKTSYMINEMVWYGDVGRELKKFDGILMSKIL